VVQEAVERVEYWHVELPRHDVVLAEGLAAESYLDVGERSGFGGGGVVALHPVFGLLAAEAEQRANGAADARAAEAHVAAVWEAAGCVPLVVAGPELAAARAWVDAWAETERAADRTVAAA
jgi:hypothetical protein